MTRTLRIALATIIALATLEIGSVFPVTGLPGFTAPAEALVGRPLTPVSVAGVGRRTVRRCAVGVYNC